MNGARSKSFFYSCADVIDSGIDLDDRQRVGRHLPRVVVFWRPHEDREYYLLFFHGDKFWIADMVLYEVVEREAERLRKSILRI